LAESGIPSSDIVNKLGTQRLTLGTAIHQHEYYTILVPV